jgi:hypothetical protein
MAKIARFAMLGIVVLPRSRPDAAVRAFDAIETAKLERPKGIFL